MPVGGPVAAEEEDEEVLEQKALGRIIFAFQQYAADAELDIARWEHNYRQLSERHRTLLHTLPLKFRAARTAARQNSLFIQALLAAFAEEDEDEEEAEQQPQPQADGSEENGSTRRPMSRVKGALAAAAELKQSQVQTSPVDVDKVRYVLKNLVRDWSAEGALERQQSYGLLIQELKERFAGRDMAVDPPAVLAPGAGLARLCVDIAAAGFQVQGNEFSYFMLVTASFLLNNLAVSEQWTLHPWLHTNVNNVTDADQLRPVSIPDVVPREVVRPGLLSMCAGDFADVYARPEMAGRFDAVVTCFFIDTAHNILEYLEVIHSVLKPGGYWIHLGPLLWHWADSGWEELSVEVSLAEVLRAAHLLGFDVLQQRFVDAAYIANVRGMYKTVYQAAFWTMVKSERQLPQDLGELVKVVAAARQQGMAAAQAGAAATQPAGLRHTQQQQQQQQQQQCCGDDHGGGPHHHHHQQQQQQQAALLQQPAQCPQAWYQDLGHQEQLQHVAPQQQPWQPLVQQQQQQPHVGHTGSSSSSASSQHTEADSSNGQQNGARCSRNSSAGPTRQGGLAGQLQGSRHAQAEGSRAGSVPAVYQQTPEQTLQEAAAGRSCGSALQQQHSQQPAGALTSWDAQAC